MPPILLAGLIGLAAAPGCKQAEPSRPPPDAQRPVIKSQAELAAEREASIRAGQVVPTSSPVILGADRVTQPPPRPRTIQPSRGAIEPDILMVNNAILTVSEVLYPLREQLEELRRTQTAAGFRERAALAIRDQTRRDIGGLLIYAQAMSGLDEKQRRVLDEAVSKEVDAVTQHEFDSSSAKLLAHLNECGLTLEQFRARIQRDMVVRQYMRDHLMPQIQIRRDELLEHYQRHLSQYETPETRELLLIEFPFEQFLPAGQSWDSADRMVRAAAKLAATRRAREAYAALESQPFAEVAAEYSLGLHAGDGGSWGQIGQPLNAPYDEVSRLIFSYEPGQHSEPIETATGWYIVGCGHIELATRKSFADVQEKVRQDLMERRYARLSGDYVFKLAENATVSSVDLFVSAAVQKVEGQHLPATAAD